MDFNSTYKKLYENISEREEIDEDTDFSKESSKHNNNVKKIKIDSIKKQETEQKRHELIKKKNRDDNEKCKQMKFREILYSLA